MQVFQETLVNIKRTTTYTATSKSIVPFVTPTQFINLKVPLANDLTNLTALTCRLCTASILSLASLFSKTVNLPSEHWHEILDCWRCHDESYSDIQRAHIHGTLRAQRGVLQVGCAYLGIHHDDLDAVYLSEKNERENRVVCECGAVLGRAVMEGEAFFAVLVDIGSVAVGIAGVAMHLPDHGDFLVESLMNSVDNHAAYRYTLQTSDKSMLYELWVVNPEVVISVGEGGCAIAAKVMYFMSEGESEKGWDGDGQVETMSLTEDTFAVVLERLEESSRYLPVNERVGLNGFAIGYLKRLLK